MSQPLLQLVLAEGAGSALGGVMPIVLMFAVVYFIVLRPMSRQEKDRKKRVESLKKGDQVVIGGGILGRISNLDDPKVAVVEIADRVKIKVLRKDIVDAATAALADEKGAKPATPTKDAVEPELSVSPPSSDKAEKAAKTQADAG
ncbi:MAG: preprotein translocase subunit YajC [Deltaproteobacteria bacterium]|nr:preprotein translocase subunit YajC [Nannocystaceae bacterium]